jgi:hypothetical protein
MVGLLVVVAGCTFNLEEETSTIARGWRLAGATAVVLDDIAFKDNNVKVYGIGADSLVFSCAVRRLVVTDDNTDEYMKLTASREDGQLALGVAVSGEDWVGYKVDDVSMRVGRVVDMTVDIATGKIESDGVEGFHTLRSGSGDVTLGTLRGCEVEVGSGRVTVTVGYDSLDLRLDSAFAGVAVEVGNGDIDISVPEGFRASLDLSTARGEVSVPGVASPDQLYTGDLNGGDSTKTISCNTGRGSITIEEYALP